MGFQYALHFKKTMHILKNHISVREFGFLWLSVKNAKS